MNHNPYQKFRGRELSLNDHLAIDRTILANERTLLAYGRTALALVIVGGSCIKFFDSVWLEVVGMVFILSGALVAIRGWQRYGRMQAYMAAALDEQTGQREHPLDKTLDAPKSSDSGVSNS